MNSTPNTNQSRLPVALFHRAYSHYTGGHGQVWDYFNYIKRSGLYQARIYFTSNSVFDEDNPWNDSRDTIIPEWQPDKAHLLFLAGMDWNAIPVNLPKNIPIINLIQGIRHSNPDLPLYGFLQNYAIRICVSQPVADAILATGLVNGPVFVIPNGIPHFEPVGMDERSQAVFIGAIKNKILGMSLADQLLVEGYEVDLLMDRLPKTEYLQRLGKARLAILLPEPAEGFFLPGLEAMALGTPVIMPDCIGNREFARNNENCLIASPENIVDAVRYLDRAPVFELIRQTGIETGKKYNKASEYKSFLAILSNIKPYSAN